MRSFGIGSKGLLEGWDRGQRVVLLARDFMFSNRRGFIGGCDIGRGCFRGSDRV